MKQGKRLFYSLISVLSVNDFNTFIYNTTEADKILTGTRHFFIKKYFICFSALKSLSKFRSDKTVNIEKRLSKSK